MSQQPNNANAGGQRKSGPSGGGAGAKRAPDPNAGFGRGGNNQRGRGSGSQNPGGRNGGGFGGGNGAGRGAPPPPPNPGNAPQRPGPPPPANAAPPAPAAPPLQAAPPVQQNNLPPIRLLAAWPFKLVRGVSGIPIYMSTEQKVLAAVSPGWDEYATFFNSLVRSKRDLEDEGIILDTRDRSFGLEVFQVRYCDNCGVECVGCRSKCPPRLMKGDWCWRCAHKTCGDMGRTTFTPGIGYFATRRCGQCASHVFPRAARPTRHASLDEKLFASLRRKTQQLIAPKMDLAGSLMIPQRIFVGSQQFEIFARGDGSNPHALSAACRFAVEAFALKSVHAKMEGLNLRILLCGPGFTDTGIDSPRIEVYGRHPSWPADILADVPDGESNRSRNDFFKALQSLQVGAVVLSDRHYFLTATEAGILEAAASRGVHVYVTGMPLPEQEGQAILWPPPPRAGDFRYTETLCWTIDGHSSTRVNGNFNVISGQKNRLPLSTVQSVGCMNLWKVPDRVVDARYNAPIVCNAAVRISDPGEVPFVLLTNDLVLCVRQDRISTVTALSSVIRSMVAGSMALPADLLPTNHGIRDAGTEAEDWFESRRELRPVETLIQKVVSRGSLSWQLTKRWFLTSWRSIFAVALGILMFLLQVPLVFSGIHFTKVSLVTSIVLTLVAILTRYYAYLYNGSEFYVPLAQALNFSGSLFWLLAFSDGWGRMTSSAKKYVQGVFLAASLVSLGFVAWRYHLISTDTVVTTVSLRGFSFGRMTGYHFKRLPSFLAERWVGALYSLNNWLFRPSAMTFCQGLLGCNVTVNGLIEIDAPSPHLRVPAAMVSDFVEEFEVTGYRLSTYENWLISPTLYRVFLYVLNFIGYNDWLVWLGVREMVLIDSLCRLAFQLTPIGLAYTVWNEVDFRFDTRWFVWLAMLAFYIPTRASRIAARRTNATLVVQMLYATMATHFHIIRIVFFGAPFIGPRPRISRAMAILNVFRCGAVMVVTIPLIFFFFFGLECYAAFRDFDYFSWFWALLRGGLYSQFYVFRGWGFGYMGYIFGAAYSSLYLFGVIGFLFHYKEAVYYEDRIVSVKHTNKEFIAFVDFATSVCLVIVTAFSFLAMVLTKLYSYRLRDRERRDGRVQSHGVTLGTSLIPKLMTESIAGRHTGVIGQSLREVTVRVDRAPQLQVGVKTEKPKVGGTALLKHGSYDAPVLYYANSVARAAQKRNIVSAPVDIDSVEFIAFTEAHFNNVLNGNQEPVNLAIRDAQELLYPTNPLVELHPMEHASKFSGHKRRLYEDLIEAYQAGTTHLSPYRTWMPSKQLLKADSLELFTKLENSAYKAYSAESLLKLSEDLSRACGTPGLHFYAQNAGSEHSGSLNSLKPRMIATLNLQKPCPEAGAIVLTHSLIRQFKDALACESIPNWSQSLDDASLEFTRSLRNLEMIDVSAESIFTTYMRNYCSSGHNPEAAINSHVLTSSFCSKHFVPAIFEGEDQLSAITDYTKLVFSCSALCGKYDKITASVYLSKLDAYARINSACPLSQKFLGILIDYVEKFTTVRIEVRPTNDWTSVYSEGRMTPHPAYETYWNAVHPGFDYRGLMEELTLLEAAVKRLEPDTKFRDAFFGTDSYFQSLILDPQVYPQHCKMLEPGFKRDESDLELATYFRTLEAVCANPARLDDPNTDLKMPEGVSIIPNALDGAWRGKLKNAGTCMSLHKRLTSMVEKGNVGYMMVGAGRPQYAALSFALTPPPRENCYTFTSIVENDSYGGVRYDWSSFCGKHHNSGLFKGWTFVDQGCVLTAYNAANGTLLSMADLMDAIVAEFPPDVPDFESRDAFDHWVMGRFDSDAVVVGTHPVATWMLDNLWRIIQTEANTFCQGANRIAFYGPWAEEFGNPVQQRFNFIPYLAYASFHRQEMAYGLLFDDVGRSSYSELLVSFPTLGIVSDVTDDMVIKLNGNAKSEIWRCGAIGVGENQLLPYLPFERALSTTESSLVIPVGVRIDEGVKVLEKYLVAKTSRSQYPISFDRSPDRVAILDQCYTRAYAADVNRVPLEMGATSASNPLGPFGEEVVEAVRRCTVTPRATVVVKSTAIVRAIVEWCNANGFGWLNELYAIEVDAASMDGSHQEALVRFIRILAECLRRVMQNQGQSLPEDIVDFLSRHWSDSEVIANIFNAISGALASGVPWTTLVNTMKMVFITLKTFRELGVLPDTDDLTACVRSLSKPKFSANHAGDDSLVVVRPRPSVSAVERA